MPTAAEMVKRLQSYSPDVHIACAIWSEADVLIMAERLEIACTKEQAQDILDDMDRKHDAEYGLTWETIRSGLENLKQ